MIAGSGATVGSPFEGGPLSKIPFVHNEKMRLGVEIELQLVDVNSRDLTPVGPGILRTLEGSPDAVHIKSEIFQSMLEIETPICDSAHDVGPSLRRSMELVRTQAHDANAEVIMAGTHPFAHYAERLLTPEGRYFSLVDRNQWITRRLQIFGLHIHIGMRDGDHAIAMNNALCHYLPMILALSASSPYWHGEDTGLASSRITFFEAIPTGGHPYLLNNWSEFENLIDRLVFSRSITSIKDLWWDIRPNIEYGTIEVRIADCPPTIREVEAIVALVHTMATFIDSELLAGRKFLPPPEWILRENKWRASRHGVHCELIRDTKGTSVPFADVWSETRESMRSSWQQHRYDKFIEFIDELVANGPSYLRQRAQFSKGGTLQSVVQHLINENRADGPDWMKLV
jgi:glutamate---cysteine ligase / carboxylate-amine ligase